MYGPARLGLTLFLLPVYCYSTPSIGLFAWVGFPVDSLESLGSPSLVNNDHWVCFYWIPSGVGGTLSSASG